MAARFLGSRAILSICRGINEAKESDNYRDDSDWLTETMYTCPKVRSGGRAVADNTLAMRDEYYG